jgi:hypothetical protein
MKSLAAFRNNPDKFCAADYSILIQNLAVAGDSPVKKTKADLVCQFNHRNYGAELSMLFGTTTTTTVQTNTEKDKAVDSTNGHDSAIALEVDDVVISTQSIAMVNDNIV